MATAMEKCTACSNSSHVLEAKGFQGTKENVTDYFDKVSKEWSKYPSLPHPSDRVTWCVSKLSPSGLLKHFSLLFVPEDKAYDGSPGFTFELCYTEPRRPYIPAEVVPKTAIKTKTGSKLGSVEGSAKAIMRLGLNRLATFGDYHYVTNNCQNFCSDFAKKLGVDQPWTDLDKGKAAGGILMGLAALGAAIYGVVTIAARIMGGRQNNGDGNDDDDDDYMYDDDYDD